MTIGPRVRDLVAGLDAVMPFAWAEPWDRVGLLCGDPDAPARRVFVSLDPTPDTLERAISAGADVLLTHHPAFLTEGVAPVPTPGLAGVPYAAVRAGVALVACHTNLDRAPAGADALAHALGLAVQGPLERSAMPVDVVATYAPPEAADGLRAAMDEAGAGRIGAYEACSFTSQGTGRYRALEGARPRAGDGASVAEQRIEVFCPRGHAPAVERACRAAHPYEEPVILSWQATLECASPRMGRVCAVPEGATVESVARAVAAALGSAVTTWGEADRPVGRVALAPGSGRSLLGDAMTAGCEVFITGELRYHEALDAAASGLAIIEAGHDVTEWPLVRELASAAGRVDGFEPSAVTMDVIAARWRTTEGA